MTPEKVTQPSEAGFSTNMYLNNEKSGRVQFTFRGATCADWPAVMSNVHEFIKDMYDKGWMLDGDWREAHGLPPTAPPEHEAPVPGEKKKYEKKPVPVDQLPPELPTGSAEGGNVDYFADDFDWITVEPQPDEKATVKFWKQGLEFPVGAPINKWKNVNVTTMLQALGEIDPSKAQKIVVPGRQYWTQGKEYEGRDGSKRHYKDLRAVETS